MSDTSDQLDAANKIAEDAIQRQILAVLSKPAVKPKQPKGSCHYCDEPFGPNDARVFCDDDCIEDQKRFIDRRG